MMMLKIYLQLVLLCHINAGIVVSTFYYYTPEGTSIQCLIDNYLLCIIKQHENIHYSVSHFSLGTQWCHDSGPKSISKISTVIQLQVILPPSSKYPLL